MLVPKWPQLKKVQGHPLLEKYHPQYQCPPLLSPALALLRAQIAGAVPGEQSRRGKPVALFGGKPETPGASAWLGQLQAAWADPWSSANGFVCS